MIKLGTMALSLLLLAACGGASAPPSGPTAQQVIDAFEAANLPVLEPRDTSPQCQQDVPGCTERVTNESLSVLRFSSEAPAVEYETVVGDGAHRRGLLVLSYAAARTPDADRPRYEAVFADVAR